MIKMTRNKTFPTEVTEKMRPKLMQLRGNTPRSVVSKRIGITPQMLGAIERGDRNPSLKLAKKIADYYGVSVDEIFFDEMDTNCVRNGKEDKEHAQTQAG